MSLVMRINRETDYAVRCILCLSETAEENVVVSEISRTMFYYFLPKAIGISPYSATDSPSLPSGRWSSPISRARQLEIFCAMELSYG